MFRNLILFFAVLSSICCFNASLEAVKNFADLDPAMKKQILRKATKTPKRSSTPEQLARQLAAVYTEEFARNSADFQKFVDSPEFNDFLKRHPHRRKKFNQIAIQRSVASEASEDIRVIKQEHPLFLCLTDLFGSDLPQVQWSLNDATLKAVLSQ
ncbi:MAG: hypothetical protein HYX35_06210 [Proteobacteria bacterium]|nr:hypothetical protein [Pseudomonadota bacterium]